jgi:8-oxo-dGTP pyrophosphatase MutT (NUDIX family)
MNSACGGIVIDPAGRVLLRKPAGLHKGRVWTFAKGKRFPGESPEQTAIREVLEETGVEGRILKPIQSEPDHSDRELYFLMAPVRETHQHDQETEAVVWASQEEAEELLSMTSDEGRRQRDLMLLEAAYSLFRILQAQGG